MKKITLLVIFLFAFASGSYSQCTFTGPNDQYPSDPVESQNLGFVQEISTCNYTGEYAVITNIQIGEDYVFTFVRNDDLEEKYITVTDMNNAVIAFGDSPLTVLNIVVNQIKVHYSEDVDCGEESGCSTTTLQILLTCPVPIQLSVSNITINNATFSWQPTGTETAWEVIVQTADLPAPTSTTTGTPVSTTPTYNTTTLQPATDYVMYVRANCGTEFSPWNKLEFASGCNPINAFNQDFDTTDEEDLPICWSSIVENTDNGSVGVSLYNGTEETKSVQINFADSGVGANVILVSPALGNLSLGTHRLKFKCYAGDPGTLEVGTLNGSTLGANFTLVGQALTVPTGFQEFVVDFTGYTGTDTFIGIKMTTGYSVYLDDIRWEITPLCPDVTEIEVSNTTINSATLTWTPGNDETEWDIVYGASTVTDPSTLTPITPAVTSTPEGTISGLAPGITYRAWVRSVCGVNDGAWIGPIKFTTPCLPTMLFNENFDTTDYNELPDCWSYIARGTYVIASDRAFTYDGNGTSNPNSVRLQRNIEDTEVILVSPNLSTLAPGTHRLKFNGISYSNPSSLEIGTLNSSSSQAVFSMIEEVNLTDTYGAFTIDFTIYTGTDTFIGIKLGSGYDAYLDDIRWEVAPLCPDVTAIEVTNISTTTASFAWEAGGAETGWDIVYAASNVTDPSSLTPISPSITGSSVGSISGLTAGTEYNIWVRSKCGTPNGDGAWIGPISFTTACLPITVFTENFDTTDFGDLPTCWTSIIRGEDTPTWADIYTVDYNVNSEPNSVMLDTNTDIGPDTDVILVSPNLSTLPLGSYRLKFYAFSYDPGSIEVGSLDSPANTAIFTSWDEVVVTDDYTQYVVDFTGYTGTDTFIGIRHKSGYSINLDDIRWEIAPLCPDVQDITVSGITTIASTVSWTAGGSETNWQLVYGTSDITDPSTLIPTGLLTQSTYAITGLTQNTSYNVWVRSVCGSPNGDGAWIGPITFKTQCLSTELPYVEDFESAVEPNLPNCTSSVNVGAGNEWSVRDYPNTNFTSNTLTYEYDFDNDADTWFFTRGLNLTAGVEYTISYRYGNSGDYPEKLKVYYGNSADVDGMTEELADYTNINNDANITETLTFTPTTGGVFYFGFNAYSTANQNELYVDDISIYNALDREDFAKADLRFYPNPVKDVLNLSYENAINSVSVYNLLGQIVIENTINSNTTAIDMTSLATGSYIVKITADNFTKTIKVIKQ